MRSLGQRRGLQTVSSGVGSETFLRRPRARQVALVNLTGIAHRHPGQSSKGHHPRRRKVAASSHPALLPAPRQRGERFRGGFRGLWLFLSSLVDTVRANGTVETFALAAGWSWEPSGKKRRQIPNQNWGFSSFFSFQPHENVSMNILAKRLP